MQYDDKKIFITNLENVGMFEMFSKIFEETVNAHGNILHNNQNLRDQFISLFDRFMNEHINSSRPEVFFGKKTGDEVRREAFDYGIGKAMKLFMALKIFESDVFTNFISLSGKSPKEFLNVVKDVLTPTNHDDR